mgnify:CR=1 FL=1
MANPFQKKVRPLLMAYFASIQRPQSDQASSKDLVLILCKDMRVNPGCCETKHLYSTREWIGLRYEALKQYGNRCMCCGANPGNGSVLHVDHIKPRSVFPELALNIDNLQILCSDCNIAKSNGDQSDWKTLYLSHKANTHETGL